MGKKKSDTLKRHQAGRIMRWVAAAALTGAAAGCTSPFDSDNDSSSWSNYSTAAMAHDLDAGPLNNHVDNGVHEWSSPTDDPNATDALTVAPPISNDSGTQSVSDAPQAGIANETHLSLQEVIADTMMHSLAIKVESYNPGIDQTQVVHAEAAFDSLFYGQSQAQQT